MNPNGGRGPWPGQGCDRFGTETNPKSSTKSTPWCLRASGVTGVSRVSCLPPIEARDTRQWHLRASENQQQDQPEPSRLQ